MPSLARAYNHGVPPASRGRQAAPTWTRTPTFGPLASHSTVDGAGRVSPVAVEHHLAMYLTAPGVAYAPRCAGSQGEAGPSHAAARHHAPPLFFKPGNPGSSAYAPFGNIHAPFGGVSAPMGDEASTYAHRGPVDIENDGGQLQRADDGRFQTRAGGRTTSTSPTATSPGTLAVRKRRRSAAASRCSLPSPSHTRDGGSPGARAAAASDGLLVASAGSSLVDGGDLALGRASARTGPKESSRHRGAAALSARGRSAAAGTGSTPQTRARAASPTATPSGARSMSGLATALQASDFIRSTGLGFSGVRRDITTQRKELAIMNSPLRAITKKVDEISVLADRLTASLVSQRRALLSMSGDVTSVLMHVTASGPAASPLENAGAAAVVGADPAEGTQSLAAMEVQNVK